MKWKITRRIALWLILASVALLITGTFAAYTRVEYVKRVVSSKNESNAFVFSSNYLYLRSSESTEFPLRMISVSTEADVKITITVCNYLQNDLTRVNEETITYDFTAQLVDAGGNSLSLDKKLSYQKDENTFEITVGALLEQLHISNTTLTNGVYKASGSMDGGSAATHFYEITCDKNYVGYLNGVYLKIAAVPKDKNEKLVAFLSLNSNTESSTPWSGRFKEVQNSSDSTVGLDAFNYEISGTENSKVKIAWDANKVTLSRWSKELFNGKIVESESGSDHITVNVGEDTTSYTLQFYRVGGIPENETGEQVLSYVQFSKIQ